MKTQIRADLLLILVTIFWGSSVLLTKIGLGGISEFNLIALRFIIAFVLSSIVFWKKIRKTDLKLVKYSIIQGTFLFLVFIFMTFGVKFTTVSNAGFLTCLAGVFVPIITFALTRKKPENKVIISVCMAFIGIALLTLSEDITIGIGDILCTLCSLAFAAHIMVTGSFTNKVDSVTLGILQLGVVGVYSTIFSFIFESPKLPETMESWLIVLSLSILCTAAGFIIQTVAQKHTTPTHTGLIFSLEPVFAAICAVIFVGEILSIRGYTGAMLLLLSIVLIEVKFSKSK